MNKESKLNLNAGDYAISHCDSDKTYNGLEVHKMLCDAYIAGSNDTLEDDDERIKNSLINLIKMSSEFGGLALHKWKADEMLAWIEKQGQVKESFISQHENRTCEENGNSLTYDDENVRNTLIDFFSNGAKYGGHTNGVYDKDILAWLEKQGSKDKFIEKELGCIKGYREKAIKRLEELEEQGEQKPQRMISAEAKEAMYDKPAWSEEDVRVIDDIFYSINEESVIEGLNDRGIMYALKDIRGIVRYLRNWLQDLKRRVQPQPKQEWSKKDEAYVLLLDSICESSEAEYYDNPDSIIRKEIVNARLWLKSLRHQNTWKPSDEQISLLQAIINEPNNAASESCQIVLKDILEQLKKLKKEQA